MSLVDAIRLAGLLPPDSAPQSVKKRYSELLSQHLAREVAAGLRHVGFGGTLPMPGGPGEREFQGGLGPKKIDVSYSDDRSGLLLAVSIKSINSKPYGKNLKNRFADLCTEAISLHLRFPYAVLAAMFAFPVDADADLTQSRTVSTFGRATQLMRTIAGRVQYTDPGERFEHVCLLLFTPVDTAGKVPEPSIVDAVTGQTLSEAGYFRLLRSIYNTRNPHATLGA